MFGGWAVFFYKCWDEFTIWIHFSLTKCEGKKTDNLSEGTDLSTLITPKAFSEQTTKAANERVKFYAEELIVKFIHLLLADQLSYTRKCHHKYTDLLLMVLFEKLSIKKNLCAFFFQII